MATERRVLRNSKPSYTTTACIINNNYGSKCCERYEPIYHEPYMQHILLTGSLTGLVFTSRLDQHQGLATSVQIRPIFVELLGRSRFLLKKFGAVAVTVCSSRLFHALVTLSVKKSVAHPCWTTLFNLKIMVSCSGIIFKFKETFKHYSSKTMYFL